jgi:hypothetical protein
LHIPKKYLSLRLQIGNINKNSFSMEQYLIQILFCILRLPDAALLLSAAGRKQTYTAVNARRMGKYPVFSCLKYSFNKRAVLNKNRRCLPLRRLGRFLFAQTWPLPRPCRSR